MRKITEILCFILLVLVHNGRADFIESVNTPVNNPTIQQVVSAATESFLRVLDLERAKSNSFLNAVQYIQSALEYVERNAPKDLGTEFFIEGTAGMENNIQFVREFDVFSAEITQGSLDRYPDRATSIYIDCFTKKVNTNVIPGIVNSVKDIISKGLSAESNFTAAASKCIQGQRDKLEACLANASSSILPIVPENVIHTKQLVTVAYECINKAADGWRIWGKNAYYSQMLVIPENIRFNLPAEFDPTNKTITVLLDFVYPFGKIFAIASLLDTTKKEVWAALNGRKASLSSVKAYLQPAVNNSLAVLDKIKVESSASFCLTNAKQAVADNANARAQEVIQLIIALPPPPSEKEVADVEKAFYEKNAAERLSLSLTQCVIRKSSYMFDQKKQACCIQESESDYNFFLNGIEITLDNFIRRSKYVKALINQIAGYGERAFKKQLDTDLLALERCMKKNTKLTINPSVLNFV